MCYDDFTDISDALSLYLTDFLRDWRAGLSDPLDEHVWAAIVGRAVAQVHTDLLDDAMGVSKPDFTLRRPARPTLRIVRPDDEPPPEAT
ncbi:hypothetical protein [Mesorhizobium sp.]|uniref:hypothetical protein n=1 Tax=Mesorhizobium sp. TaxID=1871066 RepID=UPI000FE7055E|nr:hypothetical protein [Mesorhizobium sp.]RWK11854.1 MAG: hypothetical protein EOR39_06980 [Mesorhizobium sp.]TIQ49051.1 MAG: hypothetical protein E5X47_14590 [Mesorhizobium sp.]TIQ58870.1 MAG: hypothetical protein E5X46_09815 [Mesorhizobium sp.]